MAEELWPKGVPAGLLIKERDEKIRKKMKKKRLKAPHPKTIQRAFSRKLGLDFS